MAIQLFLFKFYLDIYLKSFDFKFNRGFTFSPYSVYLKLYFGEYVPFKKLMNLQFAYFYLKNDIAKHSMFILQLNIFIYYTLKNIYLLRYLNINIM